MKITQYILFSFFILLTACDKRRVCSTCTYQRPDNNSIVEGQKCEIDEDQALLTDWEENFKAQVRALGGEWDTLEITCVRKTL